MTDSPTRLVFLVDAFRHDFLSATDTPNLTAFASLGSHRPLKPILGYSDAIRATFFTGRYPDETGYWMEYCYRPGKGPWQRAGRAEALDLLPSDLAQRVIKLAASTVLTKSAARHGLAHRSIRHIPIRALDRFDFTLHQPMTAPEALGVPTLFDDCREAGRPYAYLDASTMSRRDLLQAMDTVPLDAQLVFVYLHQVDMAAHLFGLHSRLFRSRLRSTDTLFGQLLTQARQRFGDLPVLVFSDHGMSSLEQQYSLQSLLRHPAFPERVVVALDATMVRLWYADDDPALRSEIRDLVARRCPGRFLTASELREHHLEFDGRLYGDEIYLLPPGHAIFPNFHSFVRPRAMHAYDPSDPDQWGIVIGPSDVLATMSTPAQIPELTAAVRAGLQATSGVAA
jgi:hypothetical protein